MDEQLKESSPHGTPNRGELTCVAASASSDHSSLDGVVAEEKPFVGTVDNSESMKNACDSEEAIEFPYDELLKGVSSHYRLAAHTQCHRTRSTSSCLSRLCVAMLLRSVNCVPRWTVG